SFFGGIVHPCVGLLFRFVLQAFLCARIRLLLAQAIDGPPPCECYHPAEWFALLLGEILGLVPDLHENLLQEIVGLSLIVNDSQDQRLENAVIAVVELRERIGVAGLDALHQFEVTRGSGFEWRGDGARPNPRPCHSDTFLWFTSRGRS